MSNKSMKIDRFLATQDPKTGRINRGGGSGNGGCPSIMKTNRNSYVVIGKRLSHEDASTVISSGVGISSDEIAVEISEELLLVANEQL